MKVLYNFSKCKINFKGVPYEDVPKEKLRIILGNYNKILEAEDIKTDKDILKKHIDFLVSEIQWNIINSIDILTSITGLSNSDNLLLFDYIFKNRKSNRDKRSLLEFVDTENIKILFHLEDTVTNIIKKIRANENLYVNMIKNLNLAS